jgi:hypothetical protein
MTTYRPGATGALLDEYERVLRELQHIISTISDRELLTVVDPSTSDPNCRSIQTILAHVVSSGYSYAIYIRTLRGETVERPAPQLRSTVTEYQNDLDSVFAFTLETFSAIREGELEQFDVEHKIATRWGQVYDIEQMMEHAIVHVMRHRRQIEKFVLSIRMAS